MPEQIEMRSTLPSQCTAKTPDDSIADFPRGRCKYNENNQSYYLLDDLELEGIELAIAQSVCRNLKAIFEECNSPAGEDRSPDGNVPEFEVTVPGEGHEHIARDEQQYCSHTRVSDGSTESLLSPFKDETLCGTESLSEVSIMRHYQQAAIVLFERLS